MEENYIIKKEDFKKLAQWATDIDSITTVVEYFVSNETEYEMCFPIKPIIKNLKEFTWKLNGFFVDYPYNIEDENDFKK